jgi:hypothetical protein
MSTPETKTDDSKLVTTDTVYVSPDGTTDEAFPKPDAGSFEFTINTESTCDSGSSGRSDDTTANGSIKESQ